MELTHLFIGSLNSEVWGTINGYRDLYEFVEKSKTQFNRYKQASKMLGLPMVIAYTNFINYVCDGRATEIQHISVHNYITMASVLTLKKLWKTYLFSSAIDFTSFNLLNNSTADTDKYELLCMHVLSVPDFFCFSAGAKTDRVDKTLALVDNMVAQKTLHPCLKADKKNCSLPTCNKCLRGLLTLDLYNKLDNMNEVFDVDLYRRKRQKYLIELCDLRNNEFFEKLYKLFCKKYPTAMAKARIRIIVRLYIIKPLKVTVRMFIIKPLKVARFFYRKLKR